MTDLNIVGKDVNDTVLYLSRILDRMGNGVLIRDYTSDHRLSICVPIPAGISPAEEIIDYAGVGYTFSRQSSEGFDTVIRIYDYDRLPDSEDGVTLIIADETKAVAETLKELEWDEFKDEGNVLLMVKNYTGVVRKQFEPLIDKAGIKKTFPIPLNDHDVKCAILAEYQDTVVFQHLSPVYAEALMDICREVRKDKNYSIKDVEKIYKEAAKGARKKI